MRPPRLALLLLAWLLPPSLHEPIAGDLEEDFRASAAPSRRRFWALTLQSIGACWADRLRLDTHRLPRLTPRRRGDNAMQSLLQDLRYGLRLMRRNPGFTLAAVATLSLGIGANSAIFSIVNILSLKPLPYAAPDRITFVLGWDLEQNDMRFNLRQADLRDLQRDTTTFDALAAYTYVSANLTGGDIPDRVQAYRVTPNTFPLLGVPAALGRTFDDEEIREGGGNLAVISYGLWQRRFGGSPAIVGRQIVVNGEPFDVIGVMPRRFEFPVFNFKGDLWLPWTMRDAERGRAAATDGATVVGRLREGVSYAEAQAEVDRLMRGYAEQYPQTNRALGARLIEMGKLDDEQAGPAMLLLLVTVGIVLVLACANVANLLLARGAARQHELAVRAAIGASRLRIGRQLLIEGALLALTSGALGVLFAVAGLAALRSALPEMVLTTQPNIDELGVDRVTLGYTFVISLLTSVVFGILPAWRASRDRFDGALKDAASTGGTRGARRLRASLVIAEVALATVLLVAAGLLVRSYVGLQEVSPGFDAAGVMTMTITLPEDRYPDAAARRRFYEDVIARVERLPGVSAAGFVNVLPFSTYNRGTRIVIDGAPAAEPGREPAVAYRSASPGYHQALRIPLVLGRHFDARDTAASAPVAIVNETLASRYLAGGSPIGRRIRIGPDENPWLTVVGVIGDVRHSSLGERWQPEIHLPLAQAPSGMMMLAARSALRAEDLTNAMRQAIQTIDPAQPVYHVKTLETLVADSTLPARTSAVLVSLFSVLALVLAVIGIYGVIAYTVSQQQREFGVRLALGATPRNLLRHVMRSAILMVGAGIVIGMVAAAGASRMMAGMLFGVSPTDPLTYAVVFTVLTGAGLAASAVPGWRASVTKPLTALRAE